MARDFLDALPDGAQVAQGVGHAFGALGHRLLGLVCEAANPGGGGGAALRQLADFLGYHREAFALGPGLGGLDGSVEAQEVGLAGDILDDLDGPDDLACGLPDGGNAPLRILAGPGAVLGVLGGGLGTGSGGQSVLVQVADVDAQTADGVLHAGTGPVQVLAHLGRVLHGA